MESGSARPPSQQPAGFHQFVEGVADDFGVVQPTPLLAVDVAQARAQLSGLQVQRQAH